MNCFTRFSNFSSLALPHPGFTEDAFDFFNGFDRTARDEEDGHTQVFGLPDYQRAGVQVAGQHQAGGRSFQGGQLDIGAVAAGDHGFVGLFAEAVKRGFGCHCSNDKRFNQPSGL